MSVIWPSSVASSGFKNDIIVDNHSLKSDQELILLLHLNDHIHILSTHWGESYLEGMKVLAIWAHFEEIIIA